MDKSAYFNSLLADLLEDDDSLGEDIINLNVGRTISVDLSGNFTVDELERIIEAIKKVEEL